LKRRTNRPLLQKRAKELRTLAATAPPEANGILREILVELSYRKSSSARALEAEVSKMLERHVKTGLVLPPSDQAELPFQIGPEGSAASPAKRPGQEEGSATVPEIPTPSNAPRSSAHKESEQTSRRSERKGGLPPESSGSDPGKAGKTELPTAQTESQAGDPGIHSTIPIGPVDISRQRLGQVFQFLQALYELRTPVSRQVRESVWHQRLCSVPGGMERIP